MATAPSKVSQWWYMVAENNHWHITWLVTGSVCRFYGYKWVLVLWFQDMFIALPLKFQGYIKYLYTEQYHADDPAVQQLNWTFGKSQPDSIGPQLDKGKLTNRFWKQFNTLRPRQSGHHFADVIFKRIFFNENFWISIKFHWNLFLRVQLTIFQHWFR